MQDPFPGQIRLCRLIWTCITWHMSNFAHCRCWGFPWAKGIHVPSPAAKNPRAELRIAHASAVDWAVRKISQSRQCLPTCPWAGTSLLCWLSVVVNMRKAHLHYCGSHWAGADSSIGQVQPVWDPWGEAGRREEWGRGRAFPWVGWPGEGGQELGSSSYVRAKLPSQGCKAPIRADVDCLDLQLLNLRLRFEEAY